MKGETRTTRPPFALGYLLYKQAERDNLIPKYPKCPGCGNELDELVMVAKGRMYSTFSQYAGDYKIDDDNFVEDGDNNTFKCPYCGHVFKFRARYKAAAFLRNDKKMVK